MLGVARVALVGSVRAAIMGLVLINFSIEVGSEAGEEWCNASSYVDSEVANIRAAPDSSMAISSDKER